MLELQKGLLDLQERIYLWNMRWVNSKWVIVWNMNRKEVINITKKGKIFAATQVSPSKAWVPEWLQNLDA
jgi:hypothetical protein